MSTKPITLDRPVTVYLVPWPTHGELRPTIPAGTVLRPATNLPDQGCFWVDAWEGITDLQREIVDGPGVLLRPLDIQGYHDGQ